MDNEKKILIVDDEENIRWLLKKALESRQLTVHTAASGEDALKKVTSNDYLLVFSDIFMEGMSGLELLDQVQKLKRGVKVVVMTAQDTMNNTIEAMRKGAFDYISKPFEFDDIYRLVDKAIESASIEPPQLETAETSGEFSMDAIVGKSRKMQEVFKTIGKSAMSDLAMLITGESGTGKELVARALHYYSNRVKKPFICINCAAIARDLLESELFGHEKGAFTGAVDSKKGKFELADGGTLFLDEIGDMEIQLQAKILRVLQDREFYRVGGKEPLRADVRIVAATNQDLEDLMEKKMFRSDLFHRLNVIHIHLPPLRERPEDILLLANHFLSRFADKLTRGKTYFSPEVEQVFRNYPWRGNIRELENTVKRGLVLASAGPILPEHLPPQLMEEASRTAQVPGAWEVQLERLVRQYLRENQWEHRSDLYDTLISLMEKQVFKILLDKYKGNHVATAKILGINRNTLKRKIDAFKLEPKKRGTENSTADD